MKKYIILSSFFVYINASPVVYERFNIHQSHRVAHQSSIKQAINAQELKVSDLTEWDKYGNTPLHYAVFYNNKKSIRELLDFNVDINAQNQFGWTPLLISVFKSHQDVMMYLIHKGANLYLQDTKGRTVFDVANQHQLELIHTLNSMENDIPYIMEES